MDGKRVVIRYVVSLFGALAFLLLLAVAPETNSAQSMHRSIAVASASGDANGSAPESMQDEGHKKIDIISTIVIPVAIQSFGAFLGVLGALFLNGHTERTQQKEVEKSFHDEIVSIKDELRERLSRNEDYTLYRYLTPAWDSGVSSGVLASPINRKTYKKYVNVYSLIQFAQEIEREYTQCMVAQATSATATRDRFLEQYIEDIKKERKKLVNQILAKIEELLK